MMFLLELITAAENTLSVFKARQSMIVTAESCTGGLISAVLTEIPGSSEVVERGFVTYSNAAKSECLNVSADLLEAHGAVSREVALAMASGALENSKADFSVAVTGVAGPDGGTPEKPVGLVYIAAADRDGHTVDQVLRLGDIGRTRVRFETVIAALGLVTGMLDC